MSQALKLNVLPESLPLKMLLLRRCIKQLDKLKVFGADKFVHETITFLESGAFPYARYEGVPQPDMEAVVEAYKFFAMQVINLSLTKEKALADLAALGLSAETGTIVLEAILGRKAEIKHTLSLLQATLHQNFLKDFDWKINLSLASDRISKMRVPVLILELKVHQNLDNTDKYVTIELTKEEADSMIGTLEHINTELIKLRV